MSRTISGRARRSLAKPRPWASQGIPACSSAPPGWERDEPDSDKAWKIPPASWHFSETYQHWFYVPRCKQTRRGKCAKGARCRKVHVVASTTPDTESNADDTISRRSDGDTACEPVEEMTVKPLEQAIATLRATFGFGPLADHVLKLERAAQILTAQGFRPSQHAHRANLVLSAELILDFPAAARSYYQSLCSLGYLEPTNSTVYNCSNLDGLLPAETVSSLGQDDDSSMLNGMVLLGAQSGLSCTLSELRSRRPDLVIVYIAQCSKKIHSDDDTEKQSRWPEFGAAIVTLDPTTREFGIEFVRALILESLQERFSGRMRVEGGNEGEVVHGWAQSILSTCGEDLTKTNLVETIRTTMDEICERQLGRLGDDLDGDPLLLTKFDVTGLRETPAEDVDATQQPTDEESDDEEDLPEPVPELFKRYLKVDLPPLVRLTQSENGPWLVGREQLNLMLQGEDELRDYDEIGRLYHKELLDLGAVPKQSTITTMRAGCRESDEHYDNIDRITAKKDGELESTTERIGTDEASDKTTRKRTSKIKPRLRGPVQRVIDQVAMNGGVLLIRDAHTLCYDCREAVEGIQKQRGTDKKLQHDEKRLVVILEVRQKKNRSSFQRLLDRWFTIRLDLSGVSGQSTHDKVQLSLVKKLQEKYEGRMDIAKGIAGPIFQACVRRLADDCDEPTPQDIDDKTEIEVNKMHESLVSRYLEGQSSSNGNTAFPMVLGAEELLGKKMPDLAQIQGEEWQQLQAMVGLASVKASITSLFSGMLLNYYREVEGMKTLETGLSKVFLGPPGTGKTTVAKLYGAILAKLGYLSSGKLVVKKAGDFIGAYIGHSALQTNEILKETKGCVLLIDEAYMLCPSRSRSSTRTCSFRTEAVDTLVSEIQNTPGEDRCIILCGYKDEMEALLRDTNPGLARRFPIEDAFEFEDFTTDELGQILDLKMAQQCMTTDRAGRKMALEALDLDRQRPNFGNGGAIDNLLSRAKTSYQARFASLSHEERVAAASNILLTSQDFDPQQERAKTADCDVDFGMLGLDQQTSFFEGLIRQARSMRKYDKDPKKVVPFTLVLKGPPGTGKTTFARQLGRIYHQMGVLTSSEVVEASAQDLISQFCGESGIKTTALLRRGLGKTLFIDEAYRLTGDKESGGGFAAEARDALVDGLTKPMFFRKLVVVLVGYDGAIEQLLSMNPGLAGRFPTAIQFEKLSSEMCTLLLKREIEDTGVAVSFREDDARIHELFDQLRPLDTWASGRDVQTLAGRAARKCFDDVPPGEEIDASRLSVDKHMIISIMEQWCEDHGLHVASKVARIQIDRAEEEAPFPYDHLDRSSNVIRVISFDKPCTEESGASSDVISCHLETVDLDDYTRSYRTARGEIKRANDLFTGDDVSHAQKEAFNLFAWRMRSGTSATELDDALQMWGRQIDTPDDIRWGGRYLEPRFHWGDFLALSYVWGDASEQQEILLNGRPFMVRKNLYSALRRLRSSDEIQGCGLKVWIDAICINQNDLDERAFQVSKMASIYSKAVCVRGHMGDPPPGTEDDIKCLQACMQDCRDVPPVSSENGFPLADNVENLDGSDTTSSLSHLDKNTIRALQRARLDFLKKPYFRRLWIVQEIKLASSIVLWYGDSCFPPTGNAFDRALLAQAGERGLGLVGDETKQHLRLVHTARQNIDDMFLERQPEHSIFAVLLARDAAATDPRDKVYGILGLIHPDIARLVKIDYSERNSCRDVYLSFAVAFVKVEQNPVARAGFEVTEAQLSGKGVPTWAFDFDCPVDIGSPFIGLQNRHLKSRTSRRDKVRLSFSADRRLLHCQGCLFIDVVMQPGPKMGYFGVQDAWYNAVERRPFKMPDEIRWTPRSGDVNVTPLSVSRVLLQNPFYEFSDSISPLDIPWDFVEYIQGPSDSSPSQISSKSGRARGRQTYDGPPLNVTLEDGDVVPVGEFDFKYYNLLFDVIYNNRNYKLGSKTLKEYFATEPTLQLQQHPSVFENGFGALGAPISGRLLSTHHGLIGSGPGAMRTGDLICIMPGKDTPVVLRRKGAHYQLIGDCYVDGLMRGEARTWFDEGRLETMDVTLC